MKPWVDALWTQTPFLLVLQFHTHACMYVHCIIHVPIAPPPSFCPLSSLSFLPKKNRCMYTLYVTGVSISFLRFLRNRDAFVSLLCLLRLFEEKHRRATERKKQVDGEEAKKDRYPLPSFTSICKAYEPASATVVHEPKSPIPVTRYS